MTKIDFLNLQCLGSCGQQRIATFSFLLKGGSAQGGDGNEKKISAVRRKGKGVTAVQRFVSFNGFDSIRRQSGLEVVLRNY